MMSPKQALVIGVYGVVCLTAFSLVYCGNAEVIGNAMTRHDTGRIYLLMWALPSFAFAGLALASAAVLIGDVLKRHRQNRG